MTLAITPAISDTAVTLSSSFPGDPADRLIYATAVERGSQHHRRRRDPPADRAPRAVYALHMLSERLQILVTPEQRRRLDSEARERGTSVGGLIREAIDSSFGGASRAQRIRAAEEIAAMSGSPYLPPDELDRAIDEEREKDFARLHASR